MPTTFEKLIAPVRPQQESGLKTVFLHALGKNGMPLPEEELSAYLPRLTVRKYPNGFTIFRLDASSDHEGEPLFSLDPPAFRYNPMTGTYADVMDVRFGQEAAHHEAVYRARFAHPRNS